MGNILKKYNFKESVKKLKNDLFFILEMLVKYGILKYSS